MIVFEGKMNKQNKYSTAMLYVKKLIIFNIIITILTLLIIAPIYFVYSWYCLWFLILLPFLWFLSFLVLVIMPVKIVFSEDTVIIIPNKKYTGKQTSVSIGVDEIVSITDIGDAYVCLTRKKFRSLVQGFVCQKDLLVKGTLEEFERIFADKITNKTDN